MKFKKITHQDKALIETITHQFKPYSDFNFVSLITWGVNNSSYFHIENDVLYIKLRDYMDKDKYTYSILGKTNIQQAIIAFFECNNIDKLELVAGDVIELLGEGQFLIEHQRDEDDYIYDINELLSMDGPEYRKLRRSLSNFHSKNSFKPVFKQVTEYDEDVFHQVLELTKKWRVIRNRSFSDSASEYYAVRRALGFFDKIGIKLWVLMDGKDVIGYVITESYDDIAIIHFEKCNTNIPGAGSYLKHRVVNELQKLGGKFLNYEQDLGLPGLREQKLSLNPSQMLEKFAVTPKH